MFCSCTLIGSVHSLRHVKHNAMSFVPGLKQIGLKVLRSAVASSTDHKKNRVP